MAITRATNLAAVGSGLGTSPAQPINVGTGVTIDGNSGIITATAATFGNVTVGGTLTYDDVTNIDSIGLITARNGLQVLAGVTTLSGPVTIGNTMSLGDFVMLRFGAGNDLKIYHNASNGNSIIQETGSGDFNILSNNLNIRNQAGNETLAAFRQDGSVSLNYDTSKKFETTSDGILVTGIASVTAGVAFTGFLREGINIISGKLSDNTTINIDHSMAHYFTTAESTTGIPNFTSTAGINTDMSVGETFSVNVITTAAAAGYSTGARIDAGATLPVLWNGGDDPSEGGSSGVDVYTYQVIKTGDAAFTVLGNVSNFA